MTYHPDLLRSPSGYVTPLSANMSRNLKLALTSAKQIAECMVFADLVDSTAYVSERALDCADLLQTSNPFIVQPLFVAA